MALCLFSDSKPGMRLHGSAIYIHLVLCEAIDDQCHFWCRTQTDLQAAVYRKGQNEPYIIACKVELQNMLVVDGHIVYQVDQHDIYCS